MGCHFLLQGISPAQGLNPGFLCCGQTRLSEPQGKLVSESCLVVSDSLQPYGLYSPWNSPDHNTGVGSLSLLQGSSQPRDQTQVCSHCRHICSHCRHILYQLGHKGIPRILGSLSLLQGIFLTQELNQGLLSNRGLLHCRWILYQLSYQGSPRN